MLKARDERKNAGEEGLSGCRRDSSKLKTPWTEEPGRLYRGLKSIRYDQ